MKQRTDGTFWVIETARTEYWDGRKGGTAAGFTPKIKDAAKFYDEASAEVVRCWMLEGVAHTLRSVEHSFIPTSN